MKNEFEEKYLIIIFQGRREELFKVNPKYRKFYNFIKKSDAKLDPEQLQKVQFEREFLSNLLKKFVKVLSSIPEKGIVINFMCILFSVDIVNTVELQWLKH